MHDKTSACTRSEEVETAVGLSDSGESFRAIS